MKIGLKLLGGVAGILLLGTATGASANPTDVQVRRIAPDSLRLTWKSPAGVDIFFGSGSEVEAGEGKPIASNDLDGVFDIAVPRGTRPFFELRDHPDGRVVRAAERLVPLQQGSNFRDLGGYEAQGGKSVRWGLIYRSGATPLLTPGDLEVIRGLRLVDLVDLRSSEERQLAQTRIEGVAYHAIGYSAAEAVAAVKRTRDEPGRPIEQVGALHSEMQTVYGLMPEMMAPHMRMLFRRLLANEGPLVFNCSAGQDRTGFAAALILSALGVPRETIMADYDMSTALRQRQYEMPVFDPAAFPDKPAFAMFKVSADVATTKPLPLKAADGTPFLAYAFAAIEERYGSVESYLDKVVGVRPQQLAALRATYLE